MPDKPLDEAMVDQVHRAARRPTADRALPLPSAASSGDVVAVGEATHGSKEFVHVRADVMRQLVQEHGTRLVALEASAAATVALDRTLSRGATGAELVGALGALGYWTWNVREVLELLEWVAAWNAQHPGADRVRLVGVDPAVPGSALARLRGGAACHRDLSAALDRLDPLAERDGKPVVRHQDLPRITEAAADLEEALLVHVHAEEQQAVVGEDLGPATLLDCRILLAGLRHEVDLRRRGLHPGAREGLRDQRMAELLALHRTSVPAGSGPVLLLAHNVHVARQVPDEAGYRPLGAILAEELGDRYYALAQLFGRGSFLAKSVAAPWLQRRPRRHHVTLTTGLPLVEHLLDLVEGTTPYVLDLREGTGSVSEALSRYGASRAFGAQVLPFLYRTSATPSTRGAPLTASCTTGRWTPRSCSHGPPGPPRAACGPDSPSESQARASNVWAAHRSPLVARVEPFRKANHVWVYQIY